MCQWILNVWFHIIHYSMKTSCIFITITHQRRDELCFSMNNELCRKVYCKSHYQELLQDHSVWCCDCRNTILFYHTGSQMVLADTQWRAHVKDADTEISEEDLNAQVHMVFSGISNVADVSKIRHFTADILSEIVQHIVDPTRKINYKMD